MQNSESPDPRSVLRELLFIPQIVDQKQTIPQSVIEDMLVAIPRILRRLPEAVVSETSENSFETATLRAREAVSGGFGAIVTKHENHWHVKAVWN